MDIISYGTASKAAKGEKDTRLKTLGEDVTGDFSTMKERIDHIDKGIANVTKQADKLIINNAVNIMKAHAQLNAIAKTKKYNMHQMIFDDLLDLSGIDATKSSGYDYNEVDGAIIATDKCVIETETEVSNSIPNKAILHIEKTGFRENTAIPHMSEDVSEFGTVYASSFYSGVYAYEPWRVFDGVKYDRDSSWVADGKQVWISYEFSESKVIDGYSISSYDNNLSHMPKEWIFEASNDGFIDDIVVIDYRNNEVNWKSKETRKFSFNNHNKYKSYRLSILDNNGFSRTAVSEIEMYEAPSYYISRNDGEIWEKILPDNLFYFSDKDSPQDNKIKLKIELPKNLSILNYALTWA